MRKSKIHFEQIPVEIVKKIIEDLPEKKEIGNDKVMVESPPRMTEPYGAAHLLCRRRVYPSKSQLAWDR